jgi:DUF1365 family protein
MIALIPILTVVGGLIASSIAIAALLSLLVVLRFALTPAKARPSKSFLYVGRVRHTRLRGGSEPHSLDYPIFFSYIDIDEIQKLGWSFWPIFALDSKWTAFSSLDNCEHLKAFKPSSPKASLAVKTREYLSQNLKGKDFEQSQICLLSHLSYFGYCFNPVSFFYIYKKDSEKNPSPEKEIDLLVTEVSNTPWIEQHPYVLHEEIEGVQVKRSNEEKTFEASWRKEFHVSPFMEMDYKYTFTHNTPGEKIWVRSRLTKLSTDDVWFTASFDIDRMDFTPLNLLYVLICFPLHTRVIQVWIHWEAVKLWWKNVPTFEHPQGTDVDFGFGISGKRLAAVLGVVFTPISNMIQLFSSQKSKVA